MMLRPALLLSAAALVAACGGQIIETPSSSSGTGGTATTSTSSASTAPAGLYCGGFGGVTCEDPNTFCLVSPDACGGDDVQGICTTISTSCPTAAAEVCTCSSATFHNMCQAYAFGQSVAHDGACAPQDPSFRAVRLEGAGPRIALLVSSAERGVCFRVVAVQGQGSSLGIDGTGWSVESVTATHDPADCDVAPGSLPAPAGETAAPLEGKGALAVWKRAGVCAAFLDAKVLFGATPPSWLSPEEYVFAPTIQIEGGCP